jgi:hypothetical protein
MPGPSRETLASANLTQGVRPDLPRTEQEQEQCVAIMLAALSHFTFISRSVVRKWCERQPQGTMCSLNTVFDLVCANHHAEVPYQYYETLGDMDNSALDLVILRCSEIAGPQQGGLMAGRQHGGHRRAIWSFRCPTPAEGPGSAHHSEEEGHSPSTGQLQVGLARSAAIFKRQRGRRGRRPLGQRLGHSQHDVNKCGEFITNSMPIAGILQQLGHRGVGSAPRSHTRRGAPPGKGSSPGQARLLARGGGGRGFRRMHLLEVLRRLQDGDPATHHGPSLG